MYCLFKFLILIFVSSYGKEMVLSPPLPIPGFLPREENISSSMAEVPPQKQNYSFCTSTDLEEGSFHKKFRIPTARQGMALLKIKKPSEISGLNEVFRQRFEVVYEGKHHFRVERASSVYCEYLWNLRWLRRNLPL